MHVIHVLMNVCSARVEASTSYNYVYYVDTHIYLYVDVTVIYVFMR